MINPSVPLIFSNILTKHDTIKEKILFHTSSLFELDSSFCLSCFPNEVFSHEHTSKCTSFSSRIGLLFWCGNELGQCTQGLACWGLLLCYWKPLLSDMLPVGYDKSSGVEPLTLQLQCWALSRREFGDSRATSGRQLHSLITEKPE